MTIPEAPAVPVLSSEEPPPPPLPHQLAPEFFSPPSPLLQLPANTKLGQPAAVSLVCKRVTRET